MKYRNKASQLFNTSTEAKALIYCRKTLPLKDQSYHFMSIKTSDKKVIGLTPKGCFDVF